MGDLPWLGDSCSLVEAFRARERSPVEELEATLSAIGSSSTNAFSHLDPERAMAAARVADVSLPFGGVPTGFKELEHVEGWPAREASLVLRDQVADYTDTKNVRLQAAGAVPVGQTTASEFGGLNVSVTRLNGVTGNPWDLSRTAGGSSGGSAAAVAAGLLTLATGGDGGGSIRIPAGFCGLPGFKGTAGRIPRGPRTEIAPMTVVVGCLSRSIRDIARFLDVCAGYDTRDPYSLPSHGRWEQELGTYDLRGKRAVISPDLGVGVVRPEVAELVRGAAEQLAADTGLTLVEVPVALPGIGFEWAMSNMASLVNALGDRWPACRDDLTPEIAFGMQLAHDHFDLGMAAKVERARTEANEAAAAVFDQVDFIFAATNPDVAFGADVTLNQQVGGRPVGPENNGVLTIPANIVGLPAVSVPVGPLDGLPVGLQVIGRHHEDALLLDLAMRAEIERPWPMVAPSAPI